MALQVISQKWYNFVYTVNSQSVNAKVKINLDQYKNPVFKARVLGGYPPTVLVVTLKPLPTAEC